MRALPSLLCLAVLAAARPATASIFDAFGFGARAASMGNSHAALADDYTGVYYNPATLTVRKTPHVGTGVDVVVPDFSVRRDRPAGLEGPPDELPQSNVGVHVGLLFPLGGLIQNRFALGIGAWLPTVNVTRVEAHDVETPHFYRYDSLPDKLIVAPAVAYEIHETVSFGIGFQLLGSLDGAARVELDALTRRFVRKELQVDVEATSGLTAGLLIRPIDRLRLGVSYREALALDYHLVTDIGIKGAGRLVADIRGTSLYTPTQYTFALSGEPVPALTASLDVVWARWSAAPDPTARFDVTLDGEPLGFGSIAADSPPTALGAVDTVSPRLGLEWRPTAAWAVRGGYAFRPTPLPAQTGRANFIDADVHQLSLGLGWRFPDPLAIHEAPLTVDLAGQLALMPERRMEKAAADDPVGSYAAGGAAWHASLTVRHDFY